MCISPSPAGTAATGETMKGMDVAAVGTGASMLDPTISVSSDGCGLSAETASMGAAGSGMPGMGENDGCGATLMGGNPITSMRPGDLKCPLCGELQVITNAGCRRCSASKPLAAAEGKHSLTMNANSSPPARGMSGLCGRPLAWLCPSCGDQEDVQSIVCRRCSRAWPTED